MHMHRNPSFVIMSAGLAGCLAACGGDDAQGGNENEVITTVTLTFAPEGGGENVTAAFDDPDGNGGESPTIDPIDLADGTTYAMTITFVNDLADPPEDITEEVSDESDQHMIFYTGTAVDGPASEQPGAPLTHTYGDEDVNGLPIGLENTIVATAGTGEMTVTLRHMPPVNDTPVKTADLPQQVSDEGVGSLPGSTDAQVDFAVTVE
ncbi:MAG TPA: hypothetical protein VK698_00455 [Kofleriaceae bacterium]|nr:hypothetical protein [Kofleriaceae bacterium]